MEQTKQHRPIEDIWNELSNHPDFVVGAYYDKETVIDIIAQEIDGDYENDDELYKDAEWILNNNERRIEKNVNNCWEYGMEGCIFSDGCDLPLEKEKEKVEMIVSQEDMDIIKKYLIK